MSLQKYHFFGYFRFHPEDLDDIGIGLEDSEGGMDFLRQEYAWEGRPLHQH